MLSLLDHAATHAHLRLITGLLLPSLAALMMPYLTQILLSCLYQ